MFLKSLIFIIIGINLNLPLNDKFDILIIGLVILIFISSTKELSLNEINFKKKIAILIIIILSSINLLIPKFNIEEAHSIFLNKNDLEISKDYIPKEIYENIKIDYINNFDIQRFLKSSHKYNNQDDLYNENFINKPFAFSTDSFFQKNKYSRNVNKINFSSREDLRIGQTNQLKYNLPYDKKLRRILPYFLIYEIPQIAETSEVCVKGNLFLYNSNERINLEKLSDRTFTKIKKNECFELSSNFQYTYLFGYSINEKDNLSIKLHKNLKLKFLYLIKYLISVIILLTYCYSFFKIKLIYNSYIYLISFISTLLLTLIRDANLFNGLRYFRGGADGLLHYSYGNNIVEHLYNGNFFLALRGGENIFYFMPGLRYFSALNNIIFGETVLGYFLLCSFIPYLIFKIFEKLANKKYALILFISFIFFPIFENIGFGHFNYVWQFARYHAESLSIMFILFSIYCGLKIKQGDKFSNAQSFIIGLFLSSAVFLRPNFIPTSSFLFLYFIIILYKNSYFSQLFMTLFGFSFIFSSLIHNLYFGNAIEPFTHSGAHFIFTDLFQKYNNTDSSLFIKQLLKWNPLYNTHRLLMLIVIAYYIFKNQQTLLTYILMACCIGQHAVLLITHPDSRYAYLAWLLTFILFIKILYDEKLIIKLYSLSKKKLYK